MRKLLFLFLPLVLLTNCKAPAESAQAEPANPDQYYQPETSGLPGADGKGNSKDSKIAPGDPLSPFNADGSVKPQFPKGVIQRLNDIVRSSKDAIDRYDEIRPGLEAVVTKAKAAPADAALTKQASEGIAEVGELYATAKTAREALSAEGQKLLDSGQYYDQVVFSGMATFVSKVEAELKDDLATMNKALGK